MKALSSLLNRVTDTIPRDLIEAEEWRRRLAMLVSALLIGGLAVLFARAADVAQRQFARLVAEEPYIPLLLTPLLFVAIAALTRSLAPASRARASRK